MNPPEGGLNPAPISTSDDSTYANTPVNPEQQNMFPNLPIGEDEQKEIVEQCQQFKQSVKRHAAPKKQAMRDCYAYLKGKLLQKDLLPIPAAEGAQRDINSDRPQVFVPMSKQIHNTLYSYLKLTFFPNDEDYFRVRGKTPEAAAIEDSLTEGLKYKFKEAQISEKIGSFLYDLAWSGNASCFPCIKDDVIWEWQYDHETNEYVLTEIDQPPMPDLETYNPINFYSDPNEKDPEKAKWGYFTIKSCREIKDSNLYFNKDKLKPHEQKNLSKNQNKDNDYDLNEFNGLNGEFTDTEDSVLYDFYYFPYLKTKVREYRNMVVGIAGGEVLVRYHPNLFPRGMNPAVFTGWRQDVDSAYSTGPLEDMKEIQRLVNMMYNYLIETMARIGNRFVGTPGTDFENIFGVAGGVIISENGPKDVQAITGDYVEIKMLSDIIGSLKAEGQIVSGSQNPFQGASNVDFKKTATELQILQENSISVIREVIEHIGVMGVQRILERLMYLCADLYRNPITIRVEHPVMGTIYQQVDFSVLRSGDYVIELIGTNPSQSKQAQVQSLLKLLQLVGESPQALIAGAPVVEKIGELEGIKNIKEILQQLKDNIIGAQQPGIPSPQMGMEPNPLGGVAGVPTSLPPEAIGV